jgi:hypothetical protein
MQAYRLETTVQQDGTLTLRNLPVQVGEVVEVLILIQSPAATAQNSYPMSIVARVYPLIFGDHAQKHCRQWCTICCSPAVRRSRSMVVSHVLARMTPCVGR